MTVATRHSWAAELLAVTPSDRILEIGCGHGIATGLVCTALAGGYLTAVDRSAKMTAACARRNAGAVGSARLTVVTGAFEAMVFPEPFDRAFAVNVDFPLQKDRQWAKRLAAALKPKGMAVLVLEAPAAATAERFARGATAALEHENFAVEVLRRNGLIAVRAAPPFP